MSRPSGVPVESFLKFTFGKDGFVINPTFDWRSETERSRSETSSMKAEVGSNPDLLSLPSFDGVQSEAAQYQTESDGSAPQTEPVSRLEDFLSGAGGWDRPYPPHAFPGSWRVDAVNLDDLNDIPKHVLSRKPARDAISTADVSDSQPNTMTFGSSETDITDPIEDPLKQEDHPAYPVRLESVDFDIMSDLIGAGMGLQPNRMPISEQFDASESPLEAFMPSWKAENSIMEPTSSHTHLQPKWEQPDSKSEHYSPLGSRFHQHGVLENVNSATITSPPSGIATEETTPPSPLTDVSECSVSSAPHGPSSTKRVIPEGSPCPRSSFGLRRNAETKKTQVMSRRVDRDSPILPGDVESGNDNSQHYTHQTTVHRAGVHVSEPLRHQEERLVPELDSLASDNDLRFDSALSSLEDNVSDTDSAWMSNYSSDGAIELEENHPFLIIKPEAVRQGLLRFHAYRKRAMEEDASMADSSTLSGGQHAQPERPKRRNSAQGSEFPQEKKNDGNAPKKRQRITKKKGRRVSLACPFVKKDPLKYRGCYSYVLKRTQDVKQHLSRYHQLPIYCQRCRIEFQSEEERDTHARRTICQPSDVPVYEGVTRAQKEQLTRRVSSRMSLEDQWFTIFDVLFPGHNPRPRSAFVNTELTEDLEIFQDVMMAQGPDIIVECIQSSPIEISPLDDDEHSRYSLLRGMITEGLQILVQRWTARLFLDSGTTGAPASNQAEESASSRSFNSTNNSQPSRMSSETLVELYQLMGRSEPLLLLQEEAGEESRGQLPGNSSADTVDVEHMSFPVDNEPQPATEHSSAELFLQHGPRTGTDAIAQSLDDGGISDDEILKAFSHYPHDITEDREVTDT